MKWPFHLSVFFPPSPSFFSSTVGNFYSFQLPPKVPRCETVTERGKGRGRVSRRRELKLKIHGENLQRGNVKPRRRQKREIYYRRINEGKITRAKERRVSTQKFSDKLFWFFSRREEMQIFLSSLQILIFHFNTDALSRYCSKYFCNCWHYALVAIQTIDYWTNLIYLNLLLFTYNFVIWSLCFCSLYYVCIFELKDFYSALIYKAEMILSSW